MKRASTKSAKRVHGKIETTIYDLVEAVMDEAGTRDSSFVTLVVLHLLGKTRPKGALLN